MLFMACLYAIILQTRLPSGGVVDRLVVLEAAAGKENAKAKWHSKLSLTVNTLPVITIYGVENRSFKHLQMAWRAMPFV